jgi:competence protein ComEC
MKKPLIFYAVSTGVGCLFTLECFDNVLVGIAIAILFFIIYFTTLKRKFFIINVLFFILAVLSTLNYFNIDVGKSTEIRVLENKGYYFLGNIRGRKIILNGNIEDIKEGNKIYAFGSFKINRQFSRGIIGEYNIKKYVTLKKDIVYYSYQYKKFIHEKFQNAIGNDRAAILMGISFGDTQYFNEDQNLEFQKLGVVHAVSVSGLHMAVLYGAVENLLGFKLAVVASALYAFFTGMSAATVRAFIMIFIFKMSKIFFREYDSLSSLSLAAIVLMIAKPYYIVDVGFGLSFLATLGILLYYSKLSRKLYMLPQKINEGISLGLSSQIYSLPYIAFTIQKFSYVSLIANLFLVPIYSVVVVLGNIALIACFFAPLFNIIAHFVNTVLVAAEGSSYMILKLHSNITHLSYLEGILIIIFYMSYILYRSGYKKIKYFPIIFLIGVFLESYSFFTEITALNFENGQSIIISNKNDKIMFCSYDLLHWKWIDDIKEHVNLDKLVTNPREKTIYKIDKNKFLKLDFQQNNCTVVRLYENRSKFNFVFSSKNKSNIDTGSENTVYIPKIKEKQQYYNTLDSSIKYVIIFNRIIRVK